MYSLHHAEIAAVMAVMDFLGIGAMDLAGAECACHSPAYFAKVWVGRTTIFMIDILFAPHIFPAGFVLSLFVVLRREKHADGQAGAVFCLDKPAVLLRYFFADGKAQASTLAYLFGGEERLEDKREFVMGNAVSCVFDIDGNVIDLICLLQCSG